jgi:hypothetical protein
MAITRTTLSGAVSTTDTEVLLASITGLAVSQNIVINAETMRVLSVPTAATNPVGVLRGTRGTNVQAHATGSTVLFGPPADMVTPARGFLPRREVVAYNAAGAIANPTPGIDRVAVINGTTTLAMTLANPAKDNEGDTLFVVSNGKGAHTLTYSAGLGGGSTATDLMTFSTVAQMCVVFIAVSESWVLVGGSSGAGAVAASTVIT